MSTIGGRLRIERERFGLNQTDFGAAGGVLKQAQLKYEKDERQPDALYLQKIAHLGADVLFILTGERHENVATTPTELGFLRHCRLFPTQETKDAGLQLLVIFRRGLGIKIPSVDN